MIFEPKFLFNCKKNSGNVLSKFAWLVSKWCYKACSFRQLLLRVFSPRMYLIMFVICHFHNNNKHFCLKYLCIPCDFRSLLLKSLTVGRVGLSPYFVVRGILGSPRHTHSCCWLQVALNFPHISPFPLVSNLCIELHVFNYWSFSPVENITQNHTQKSK